MTARRDHPGYGPWKPPTETFVLQVVDSFPEFDRNTQEWTTVTEKRGERMIRDLPPDFILRHPAIPPLPQAGYPQPRQCLIDDDDAISFSLARKSLAERWNASPTEIALWLGLKTGGSGRLHVFASHHEIYFEAFGSRFYRRKPGHGGSNRPCIGFATSDVPEGCAIEERLSHYMLSRTEVEAFDPADNDDDSAAAIAYYIDGPVMGGGWFNPSGRYLSFEQAVHFLRRYEPDRQTVIGIINREYRRGALNAFSPLSLWLNHDPKAHPEDGHFFEGQIAGLAKEEFRADVCRWDAASRPEPVDIPIVGISIEVNDSSGVPIKRRLKTNINKAIEATRLALLARLRREPTADEVYVYLEEDSPEYVVDSTPEKLIWQDTKGRLHDTKRKTVANILSKIRNPG